MTANNVVRVGTRGSTLALRQTELVLEKLRSRNPALDFQVNTVRTQGDANASAPLTGMGLGVFVKEIEQQLLSGMLDLAVHSLKDLPTQLPEGLKLGALLEREDPRDVLVNRWGCSLVQLPEGARIGTSSPRRAAQLKNCNPKLRVLPVRGNVETRLAKALSDEYDGVILAAAGLVRLGLAGRVSEYLSVEEFVPPPGQGILAVEMRSEDQRMGELLTEIDHSASRSAATAERAFLEFLGGGCQLPVGAYGQAQGENLLLRVFMSTSDAGSVFRAQLSGLIDAPEELARDAYQALVEQADRELVEAVKSGAGYRWSGLEFLSF